jgi:mannose-6-phosphate isomerase-like protein (cupin superfamily)
MLKLNDVIEFIHNPLPYEQKLVSIINIKGEQIPLDSFNELYGAENKTIKIEGMERYSSIVYNQCQHYKDIYSHNGPATCHAFIAQEGSPSFGMHTDPDDVVIHCCEGRKSMIIDGQYIIIEQGNHVFIPANTPHQALNDYFSLMLSFGLEKYLIDKL